MFKKVNGVTVELTEEEKKARVLEEKEFADEATVRKAEEAKEAMRHQVTFDSGLGKLLYRDKNVWKEIV